MSTVLDAEPVVVTDIDTALPCMYHDCPETATWQWLMSCAHVWRYCNAHDAEMLESEVDDRVGCPMHADHPLQKRVRIILRSPL